jgi:hypothetical protein
MASKYFTVVDIGGRKAAQGTFEKQTTSTFFPIF